MNSRAAHPIAVFGAGGFGLEVAMLIEQINAVNPRWDMMGFFDDSKPPDALVDEWPVLGGFRELNEWPTPLSVVFAIGNPGVRKSVIEKVSNPNVTYPVLIHPLAICGPSRYVRIGEGSIVCAGTIITTHIHIGRHVVLNLSCTVGHESRIGDFSAFMPTCNISGEVHIGQASFWGTGAKVINRRKVGDHTVIGAGAVVTTDIPAYATAVGVPARVVERPSSKRKEIQNLKQSQ